MARPHPTPFGVDSEKPSTARIYDYFLGGSDNYRVDRATAERIMATVPDSAATVQANRDFLVRAVRFLAGEAGIDQFIDIGSGLPTRLNVHEVAQGVNPEAKVVYVDYDPAVRAYGDVLLATNDSVRFAQQDLREPQEILADPAVRALIDFSRPVAILLIAILPFIYDTEDPEGIMVRLREASAAGSHLVISHIVDDPRSRAVAVTQRQSATRAWTPRSRARIAGFFGEYELLDPGLTLAHRWRPTAPQPGHGSPGGRAEVDESRLNWLLAGVGRKPSPPAGPAQEL
ncbi:MAG TPA: SAM-dependent methyltransferase [Actinocrinis sp.]|nr:SAM-dependent methyltransferase [Actinocrinis sp.]